MLKGLLKTCTTAWETIPLRLGLGVIFFAHGSQKLFGWFGGPGLHKVADMLGQIGLPASHIMAAIAGGGEFLGSLLILFGLFTRFGAFLIMCVMLTAIFKVHWGHFFLPAGMEFALSQLCIAISLLLSGGGAFSIDACIQKKCSHTTQNI